MTNKKIEKMASDVWNKLITKPHEIGKRVRDGMKMIEKLDQGDSNLLFVEIDETINNLRACSVESVKRFINMILLDFSALSDMAESNYNNAKNQVEKEESESTWGKMMAYKIDTHKYKLDDMASIVDSIYKRIVLKLKNMYPATHQYISILTQNKESSDTRLEGFKKINDQDDIID